MLQQACHPSPARHAPGVLCRLSSIQAISLIETVNQIVFQFSLSSSTRS
jgi:hypothetical protein